MEIGELTTLKIKGQKEKMKMKKIKIVKRYTWIEILLENPKFKLKLRS